MKEFHHLTQIYSIDFSLRQRMFKRSNIVFLTAPSVRTKLQKKKENSGKTMRKVHMHLTGSKKGLPSGKLT